VTDAAPLPFGRLVLGNVHVGEGFYVRGRTLRPLTRPIYVRPSLCLRAFFVALAPFALGTDADLRALAFGLVVADFRRRASQRRTAMVAQASISAAVR
jgi:hypothetical protein